MRRLECEVYDGVLILSGRVPSFFEKQVAQETLAGLAGVKRIINCVEVN
jgi:osmotically-inducible protein OsmY